MSSQPPIPPVPASPPPSGGVRRHHTISASSRTARAGAREEISEEGQEWNDDEVVDQDWVGGVGAVGEKTSLHRQSSLPTRYHRGAYHSLLLFPLFSLILSLHDAPSSAWILQFLTYLISRSRPSWFSRPGL